MRKRVKGRKFHRKRDQRRALMSHLAEALIRHEKIETTETRAKALRPIIEKWVTRGRKGTLHARRNLARHLTPDSVKKLVDEIAPRFKTRPGGYTRITKRGTRKGDAAKRAIIEFVE